MKARLPNLITSVRFLLALVFFVLMENYRHPAGPRWVLDWAFGLFVFTAVTDVIGFFSFLGLATVILLR